MDKPIGIKIEETKKSIADTLNESQLHPYIMDSIMRELYEEVHSLYIASYPIFAYFLSIYAPKFFIVSKLNIPISTKVILHS